MNKFTRYYNQNRKMIWGIVIIIASIIIVLQIINHLVSQRIENNTNTTDGTQQGGTEIQANSSTVSTNRSAVNGESLESEYLKRETEVIDDFITICNNGDIQKAYDMLTDECKENMYTSIQIFKEAYYDDNFGGVSKVAEIENWLGDTYKVRMTENLLSAGKSTNGYAKQDYITVKKVDDTYKLNINNYIGFSEINKVTEQNNIKIEVLNKNTYMENEEYTIKVTNNTKGTILLDDLTSVDTLYLEGSNGMKYSFYSHELAESMLTIPAGQTKQVSIRFYSSYTSTRQIKAIVFSNLKLNANSADNRSTTTFKANV